MKITKSISILVIILSLLLTIACEEEKKVLSPDSDKKADATKSDDTKSADSKKDSGDAMMAADLHKKFDELKGKEVIVTANYVSTQKDNGVDGVIWMQFEGEEFNKDNITCAVKGEGETIDPNNKKGLKIKGTVKEKKLSTIYLDPCEMVK